MHKISLKLLLEILLPEQILDLLLKYKLLLSLERALLAQALDHDAVSTLKRLLEDLLETCVYISLIDGLGQA